MGDEKRKNTGALVFSVSRLPSSIQPLITPPFRLIQIMAAVAQVLHRTAIARDS